MKTYVERLSELCFGAAVLDRYGSMKRASGAVVVKSKINLNREEYSSGVKCMPNKRLNFWALITGT